MAIFKCCARKFSCEWCSTPCIVSGTQRQAIMSAQPTTSAVAEGEASTSKAGMSLEEKIGMAKKFDREMKASFATI